MSARILIIEDNPANMELMAYLLGAFGYHVFTAYDGASGIEMAQRELPDLIVCDVHLPKMDGYAILRHLKNNPALEHIPVIAVTALSMVGDREKLLNAGFNGYIGKPIDPESFVHQIVQFLPVILRTKNMTETQSDVAPMTESDTSKRATILVVDDSPINRELICSTLEPFGYTLLLASSVQQGLERAQREAFDMILCDVHMPNEDGFDFIRKIRAHPRLAKIPFLFFTATSGSFAESRKALELGASRFLRRPVEPQQLIDELELCLHGHSGE